MKAPDSLKKYFKKRTDAIDTFLQKRDKQFTVEDFHQLRVEIKKVHALLIMMESVLNKFDANKQFRDFKKLFDQAGKVRELQLEAEIIQKHNKNHKLAVYPDNLQMRIVNEKKAFTDIHKKIKGKLKSAYKQINKYIRRFKEKDETKYLAGEKKQLAKIVKPKTLEIPRVHELRKELKKFHYNLKSLSVKENTRAYKTRDRLQDIMGKWHDCRVMNRHLLKAAHEKNAPPSEIEPIIRLADQLLIKSQALYKKINTEKRKKIT